MRPIFIAIIILSFASGPIIGSDERPLSRHELRRQVQHLHEELLRIRKQVEVATGEKGVVRPIPNFDALENADVSELMQSVNQGLADLALAVNRLRSRDRPGKPTQMDYHTVSTSGDTYRIHAAEGIRNRSVTIANIGSEIVVNPRLIVNGKRNWFSTSDILHEILEPGMSDRDKALAIWHFLVANRYHDVPAHDGIEMHDPVRFLNIYGYGFCDDSAANFMVLAEQAGIKARVWELWGHVVPEAYFDGDWHMFDPDGEVYYLDDDGQTISSVKTLEQRPDIIRKYPSPVITDTEKLVEIYTTTDNNVVSEWYHEQSEAVHTMAFMLRPGESLTRFHDQWGLYFANRFLSEPKRYGNGTFIFEPVFAGDKFAKGAEIVHNLKVERADSTWMLVSSGNQTGTLIYRFKGPYPFLSGSVRIAGEGRIGLAFSETGDKWIDVWTAAGTDRTVSTTVPLGGYFRNGYGRPVYEYFLRLSLQGQIRQLSFESAVQVAPQSLPQLEPNENLVCYIDESEGERQVQIAFGYDLESSK